MGILNIKADTHSLFNIAYSDFLIQSKENQGKTKSDFLMYLLQKWLSSTISSVVKDKAMYKTQYIADETLNAFTRLYNVEKKMNPNLKVSDYIEILCKNH